MIGLVAFGLIVEALVCLIMAFASWILVSMLRPHFQNRSAHDLALKAALVGPSFVTALTAFLVIDFFRSNDPSPVPEALGLLILGAWAIVTGGLSWLAGYWAARHALEGSPGL